MKKCSKLQAIKEMQIKTTVRFRLTPIRTQTMTNVGEDVGKKNPYTLLVGNPYTLWKTVPQKTKN
jgi:hypothetical protein